MSGQTERQQRRKAPSKSRKGARSCIACHERFPRDSLIRLVRDPQGQVVVDRYLKAPGRGAHICYARPCIELAAQPKPLSRAFKASVSGMEVDWLLQEVKAAIETRLLDLLGIGKVAGWAVSGTGVLIRQARKVRLLVLAVDVAADTERKLMNAMGDIPVVKYGEAALLGQLQGQEHRVAIGVTSMSMAQRILAEIERRDRVVVTT